MQGHVRKQPLHPDAVSKLLKRHMKTSMLPRIRLHDLRHTHATLALAAGVHPKVVQERLGHASIAITLDTYTHASPATDAAAAEQIAALIA
jgi:integrase